MPMVSATGDNYRRSRAGPRRPPTGAATVPTGTTGGVGGGLSGDGRGSPFGPAALPPPTDQQMIKAVPAGAGDGEAEAEHRQQPHELESTAGREEAVRRVHQDRGTDHGAGVTEPDQRGEQAEDDRSTAEQLDRGDRRRRELGEGHAHRRE